MLQIICRQMTTVLCILNVSSSHHSDTSTHGADESEAKRLHDCHSCAACSYLLVMFIQHSSSDGGCDDLILLLGACRCHLNTGLCLKPQQVAERQLPSPFTGLMQAHKPGDRRTGVLLVVSAGLAPACRHLPDRTLLMKTERRRESDGRKRGHVNQLFSHCE